MAKRVPEYAVTMLLATAIFTVALFDAFLFRAITRNRSARNAAHISGAFSPAASAFPEPVAPEEVGEPARITIPSIALDAAVEKVTLADDGSMGVPALPLDTAWYSLGPRPGQEGSATIGGHVNWYHGATAIFANLHKVTVGDPIIVTDDKGKLITFIVRKMHRYDHAADAVDVFTSNDGKAHLNVITCEGRWDAATKQYASRLVVFADKKEE